MATTDNEIETLRQELKTLRKDFAELKDTLGDVSRQQWREGAASARSAGDNARERATESVHQFEAGIQGQPLTSVLSAFSVGFVLGKLLDHRSGS